VLKFIYFIFKNFLFLSGKSGKVIREKFLNLFSDGNPGKKKQLNIIIAISSLTC